MGKRTIQTLFLLLSESHNGEKKKKKATWARTEM
jgi:hypothetical protein